MTETLNPVRLDADAGTCRRIEGGWEIRFERRLRHSPERVWKALTTPEGLACWLAEADIEARPGGRMELNFRQPDNDFMPDTPEKRRQSNEVLVVQPFTRFEHTFGSNPESVVSWRLEPDGDGTHLTLVHRVPESWVDARRTCSAAGITTWKVWTTPCAACAIRGRGTAGSPCATPTPRGWRGRRDGSGRQRRHTDPATGERGVRGVRRSGGDVAVLVHAGFGRLEPGARVRWDWEMYGVGTDVAVKAIEPGRRILIDWNTADDPTEVEWRFEARGEGTSVTVENRGFEDSPAGVAKALDSNGGFNLVLAAAKFWLEHGIDPRIIEDVHAAQRRPDWKGRS